MEFTEILSHTIDRQGSPQEGSLPQEVALFTSAIVRVVDALLDGILRQIKLGVLEDIDILRMAIDAVVAHSSDVIVSSAQVGSVTMFFI